MNFDENMKIREKESKSMPEQCLVSAFGGSYAPTSLM